MKTWPPERISTEGNGVRTGALPPHHIPVTTQDALNLPASFFSNLNPYTERKLWKSRARKSTVRVETHTEPRMTPATPSTEARFYSSVGGGGLPGPILPPNPQWEGAERSCLTPWALPTSASSSLQVGCEHGSLNLFSQV